MGRLTRSQVGGLRFAHPPYGLPAMKRLIAEEFGDRIMPAIDFEMTIDRQADPKGDRVRLAMTGQFLPFKYSGAKGREIAYGVKEE
jgi:cyanate lyase